MEATTKTESCGGSYDFVRVAYDQLTCSNSQNVNWNKVLQTSLLLVSLSSQHLEALQTTFDVIRVFFQENDDATKNKSRITRKLGYKKNIPKERYQIRRYGPEIRVPFPSHPPNFEIEIFKIYDLFEDIAMVCLTHCLQALGIDPQEVFRLTCDHFPLPGNGFSTSVFNIFHYFNDGKLQEMLVTEDEEGVENCVAHFDPGFISVLAKANVPGLDIQDPDDSTMYSSDNPNFSQVKWVNFEQFMESNEVLVILGETFQRLAGGRARATLHRVSNGSSSRYNMIFELRPVVPIYYPWDIFKQQLEQQKSIDQKKESKKKNQSAKYKDY